MPERTNGAALKAARAETLSWVRIPPSPPERARWFSATIYKIGINPCVDVPARISRAFGTRGYVPVAGTINRFPFRATLVPTGGGRHRLYVNGEMRQGAGIGIGNRGRVVLWIDHRPRRVPMLRELRLALRASPQARRAFERLPPSRQKEILIHLNWLKTPEARRRNVEQVLALLLRRRPARG